MEKELDVIKEQIEKTDDPISFWRNIVAFGMGNDPHLYWDYFVSFDIDSEIQTIVSYLKDHLALEPIPDGIEHIYFGMFETGDEESPAGFYICGNNGDEDESGDFLRDPQWFPEWRYIHSRLLNDVMSAVYGVLLDKKEDAPDAELEEENLEIFDFFLILSAAITIVKGVIREIPISQNIFVGFDRKYFLKLNND